MPRCREDRTCRVRQPMRDGDVSSSNRVTTGPETPAEATWREVEATLLGTNSVPSTSGNAANPGLVICVKAQKYVSRNSYFPDRQAYVPSLASTMRCGALRLSELFWPWWYSR